MASSFAPQRASGAAGSAAEPSYGRTVVATSAPAWGAPDPSTAHAAGWRQRHGRRTLVATLVAPLVAPFGAPFRAPSGTAASGADPRSSSSAHLLGTRAGNSFGKLPCELFGHNSRGTQSSEQPGHKTRKEATASLRAADTTAASADAASCPPVASDLDPVVAAAVAAPEAASSTPLLGTNGAAVVAFRVGRIAVGRARRRMARRPTHRPFGGNFEVITFFASRLGGSFVRCELTGSV